MCTFFHQVSFLSLSLYERHALGWIEAADHIVRRVRNARLTAYLHNQAAIQAEDFEEWNDDEEHEALLAGPLPRAWSTQGR